MDSRKRSWAKSITWRIAGVGILGAITYGFTKDAAQTTGITLVFHLLRFALYYCHERLWEHTSWGRITHPFAGFRIRPDLSIEDIGRIERLLENQGYVLRQPEGEPSGVLI